LTNLIFSLFCTTAVIINIIIIIIIIIDKIKKGKLVHSLEIKREIQELEQGKTKYQGNEEN